MQELQMGNTFAVTAVFESSRFDNVQKLFGGDKHRYIYIYNTFSWREKRMTD